MNILLWVLQVLAALLYGASGIMKVFMFDTISKDARSFDALPRQAWTALGILELVCVVGLIVPAAFGGGGLAGEAHGGGRRGPGDREPRVHRGACQVPRDRAHHHGRRAGPPHGVHCVRPDVPEAALDGRAACDACRVP